MSPYVAKAIDYATRVTSGKLPACKWARMACQRYLDDRERATDDAWPYVMDETTTGDAHRVCRFAEMLPHVKAEWAKRGENGAVKLLRLEPWQCFILVNVFGWKKRADGMRRFVEATIYVPRKNGKSMLAAVVGWWMFAKDGEPGAEVYSGATKEKQAMEVFRPAKMMAARIPALREQLGVTVRAKSMTLEDGSKFEPVVGVPTDGTSPHCAIIDEFHEHKTTGLRDAMRTGMGARKQPLLFTISTAGFKIEGPCHDHWQDCEKLLQGLHVDEQHFAIIYAADSPDAWATVEEITKANPNLGASLYLEKVLRDVENAKRSPIDQTTQKTKVLNLWVRGKVSLFNVEIWRRNVRRGMKPEDFKGAEFYGGLDLAFRSDLASFAQVFPQEDKFYVFGHHFHHADFIAQPENAHFARWARDGWLNVNDGDTIDLDRIYEKVRAANLAARMALLVFDPAHSQTIIQPLMAEGLSCVELNSQQQTAGRMPEWIVEFDAAYRSGRVIHDGNPLTEWALGNCVGKPTRGGMVYLEKSSPRMKIDPITALIMGFGYARSSRTSAAPGFAFV